MTNRKKAAERARMPEGAHAILNRRNLSNGNRRLKNHLRPGMRILDVGCGSGSMTADIAMALQGRCEVVGLDINQQLIKEAGKNYSEIPGVQFICTEIDEMGYRNQFDIVTAARVLQWVPAYFSLLKSMKEAVKKGGILHVLDYNHKKAEWTPSLPHFMNLFYKAFLDWREDAGMDNEIADHLASSFKELSLKAITVHNQDEVSKRSDPDFAEKLGIWAEVASIRGLKVVEDGFIAEADRVRAIDEYKAWIRDSSESQILYLRSVEGIN